MHVKIITMLLVLLFAGNSSAMPLDGCGGDCISCHFLTVQDANVILKGKGGVVKEVRTPPLRGVWELVLEQDGKPLRVFMDFGKKYIFAGPVLSIATGQPMPESAETQLIPVEKVDAAKIPRNNSLLMGNPKGKERLIIFTDPDCPFCKKQHEELQKLVKLNRELAIYIKFLPLKIHPNAYEKSRILLAEKSLKLLDENFRGGRLPALAKKHSAAGVDATIKLASQLGINSTPTLVLPDGRVFPGYRDAAAILELLANPEKKGK